MINIKRAFILVLAFCAFSTYAQNPKERCANDIDLMKSIEPNSFRVFTYPKGTRAGMVYNSLNEVENATPEELMSSILCANSQSWVNFNELTPSQISDDKIALINKADRSKNYFDLLHKIEFKANGVLYAVVKYRLTFEGGEKPLYMSETMIKHENRWQRVNESGLTNLIFMLGLTKTQYLNQLWDGKSDKPELETIISQSLENGKLNLNQYIVNSQQFVAENGMDKFAFMFEDGETDDLNFPIEGEFKDISFTYPLQNVSFCEYFEDETNIQNDATSFGKAVLAKELLQDRQDSSLLYLQKVAFDYGLRKHEIVKYKVLINNAYQYKSLALIDGKVYTFPSELSNIQTAIQTLNPDAFWAFYNSEPSEIPEIDAVKSDFKTSEGILDIAKLGAYLKSKPKELEKYCDF